MVRGLIGISLAVIAIVVVIAALAPDAAKEIGQEMGKALWFLIGAFVCFIFGAFCLGFSKHSGGIVILNILGGGLLLSMLVFIFLALKSFGASIQIGAKGLGF